MKKILLAATLLTLAACSGTTTEKAQAAAAEDPTRAAVIAHLKKTLDDPASYQPAHWGEVVAFQQKEVDAENASAEELEYKTQLELAKISTDSYGRLANMNADRNSLARAKGRADLALHRADSVSKLRRKLEASTDTTRLGMAVVHAFRAKNKKGALVLDSALFIVFKSGEITALKLHED